MSPVSIRGLGFRRPEQTSSFTNFSSTLSHQHGNASTNTAVYRRLARICGHIHLDLRVAIPALVTSDTTHLNPCISPQHRGAYIRKIQRGCGPSSDKSKTSGRGNKDQKQHGKVLQGFQGGQTSLSVEHGKCCE
jgi:hypothetical protein